MLKIMTCLQMGNFRISEIFIFEMCLIIQFGSLRPVFDEVTPLWLLGCSISPFQLSDLTDTRSYRLGKSSQKMDFMGVWIERVLQVCLI